MNAMKLKQLIPLFLFAAAFAVSWGMKSDGAFKICLLLLVAYLFRRLGTAVSGAVYARSRRRELERMPVFSLEGMTLRMVPHKGTAQEKSLGDVVQVDIVTTDMGPFVCDRILVLEFKDDEEAEWRVAADNPCYPEFYAALGKSLPLDEEQALFAALSTADMQFTLWKRARTY